MTNKKINWANDAETDLCEELMEFVLSCGNFGEKGGMSNTVAMVVSQNQSLKFLFRNLQMRGEHNWKTLNGKPWLRPFAWLYQAQRYFRKGMGRKNAFSELKKDVKNGKERYVMLKRLRAEKNGCTEDNGKE